MTASRLDYTILLVVLLAAWQAFFHLAGPDAVSPPVQTIERLGVLMARERFWAHVSATGIAFFYGCLIALIGGLIIGVIVGPSRLARDVADPILSGLYSIPKVTLYPVILLIFGLGVAAKVAFGALHGLFPVALFTIGAIKNINPVYIKSAKVMGLTRAQTATRVLAPAALPEIITGLRVGFSATLLGTLVGELFASTQGLGFMLIRALETHNVPDVMALTLLLFAFAAIANTILLAIERRVYRGAKRN